MASLNKIQLIGRIGKNPDLKYSQSNKAIVNLSIATTESWKDKNGEKQEKTEWHRIVMFGKQAETCEKYVKKGMLLYIEGRLQTRTYEKEGQTHYITEIVANNFQFLEKRQAGTQATPQVESNPDVKDDNVPF